MRSSDRRQSPSINEFKEGKVHMSDLAVAIVSGENAPNLANSTFADEPSGATPPVQVISFAIGDDQYGVDIMAVREIKGWTDITPLPGQPEYVRGVLNLRGVIVPIVDLRCRFGQGVTEATPLHVVIIVQIDQQLVGLLGDRVLDIVSFDAAKVQPVPRTASNAEVEFLSGLVTIDNAMIALINLGNLFTSKLDTAEAASMVAA